MAVLVLVAATCSSTTQRARELEPVPDPSDAESVGSSVPPSAVGPSASGTPTGSGSVPFVSDGGGGARARLPTEVSFDLAPGRGVKGNEISIGAFEVKNGAEFVAAFGVKGLQGVDARAAQDAIVKYINSHGGMGGRTAVPLYHELDATSTDTYAAIAQAACEDFTRDREVFAVVAGTVDSAQCLAEGKTITINDADAAGDEVFVRRLGRYYYGPGQLNYDRKAKAWADGLAALGFLSKSNHYGLVYYDVPGMPQSIPRSLEPALKKHGVTIAAEDRVEIQWPDSTPDAGATIAEIQNAVLRFKTRNVTHVLLYDVNATMATFFMKQADGQEYTPYYGLESDSHLEFQNVNVPHRQLAKAIAVGWRHQEDVTDAKPVNESERLCLDILHRAGVELPDVGSTGQAITLCDMWFLLKAGLDAAPASNVDGFRLGVESLGQRFVSPRTYRTLFSDARAHDGVAATNGVIYRMSCECWVLSGAHRAVA
ncbi:MAG: ABC transporter substrate-binding protein [Acidobacteria bacterium]|nr:ABC transporter substrate-binding protein [Acidobacteriota bacterium]